MPKPTHLLAAASLAVLALTGTSACAADDPAGASSGGSTVGAASGEATGPRITVDASTTVIDVRTPAEFAEGHLEGAVNIDLSSPDFVSRISALDPAGAYVVYCRSGNRSAQAAMMMDELGITDVVDAGGLDEAARATGLPVTD